MRSQLLTPITLLTNKLNVAILAVEHLNKNTNGAASTRILGSIAFFAGPRAVFMVARDRADQQPVFGLAKNNKVKAEQKQKSYRYAFETAWIDGKNAKGESCKVETSRVTFPRDGEIDRPIEHFVEQPAGGGRKADKLHEAIRFLIAHLESGEPRTRDELFKDSKDRGITESTLRAAAGQIGVVMNSTAKGRPSTWQLDPTKVAEARVWLERNWDAER